MLERILIPLDGSATAEAILPQVALILKRKDSEVILARVVNVPLSYRVDMARAIAEERLRAKSYVRDLAGKLAGDGVRARAEVLEGSAAESLLDLAERERVGLIAMTTHGRSGVSRWMLGSVTEKVLRGSQLPMLVVRNAAAP
ncbi:MAG: universal stress protein [Planctomycetes bacterium]|nr:universal stress protein [Planctomycetota bacterium]